MRETNLISFIALTLTLTLLLSGCATTSLEDCQTKDWKNRGYKDGLVGRSLKNSFVNYEKACSKFSIAPDVKLYSEGFDKGYKAKCKRASSLYAYDKSCIEINNNYNSEYTISKITKLESDIKNLKYENRELIYENRDLRYRLDRLNRHKPHRH